MALELEEVACIAIFCPKSMVPSLRCPPAGAGPSHVRRGRMGVWRPGLRPMWWRLWLLRSRHKRENIKINTKIYILVVQKNLKFGTSIVHTNK